MKIQTQPGRRTAAISMCIALLFAVSAGTQTIAQSTFTSSEELEKQMSDLKIKMESPAYSPSLQKRYDRIADLLGQCSPINQLIDSFVATNSLAPSASLCVSGSLAVADPDFNRPLASSTGTGIGNGTVGNCSLSGSGNAVNHDQYTFNLTGCAAFPTEVTATLCGPAGCQHVGNVDTVLALYRNVAAGDPLTANGGLPGVFNPASACTNARAGQDDLGTTSGTANNAGGSTCNQVNTANCVAPCTSPSNAGGLSGMRRQLGNGRFTLVVGGFGNSTIGNYTLYVDAPAAGCSIALAPSAASAVINGRVTAAGGTGISKAVITLSGGDLASPIRVMTNGFGYYMISDVPVGQNYILTVNSKQYTFVDPTRVIMLSDSLENEDFVAAP